MYKTDSVITQPDDQVYIIILPEVYTKCDGKVLPSQVIRSMFTLIWAAGRVYDFRNLNRYNSTMPYLTKNVTNNVFLKKHLWSIFS
jgi:hypothetical protein